MKQTTKTPYETSEKDIIDISDAVKEAEALGFVQQWPRKRDEISASAPCSTAAGGDGQESVSRDQNDGEE